MKKNSLWLFVTLWVFSSLSLLTACSKDDIAEIPSATDPYPYPDEYTANKDLSVIPGMSWRKECRK